MHRFVFLVLLVVSAAPATALAAQETSEKKAAAKADRSKQINRGDLTGNMVDHRYFRTARASDSDPSGNFLGPEQMPWLERQLLDCQGPFVILACGTMWSDYVSNGKDSWGKYDPQGREEIFSLIEKHRIPGVLLASGDRHGARVFRIPRPSGYNFYEFEPASLGGRGDGPPAVISNCDAQLFGTAGKSAFGEFSFDATLPDPQVVFRLVPETGAVLSELKLTRSQLTPPGKEAGSETRHRSGLPRNRLRIAPPCSH